jgi:hypothetical protein
MSENQKEQAGCKQVVTFTPERPTDDEGATRNLSGEYARRFIECPDEQEAGSAQTIEDSKS